MPKRKRSSSPPSLKQIISSLPQDDFWNPVRDILAHGNLTVIDPFQPHDTKLSQHFGPSHLDYPHYISHTPFPSPLVGRDITELILSDMLSTTRRSRIKIHPSYGGELDERAAAKLLLNINKPLNRGSSQGIWNYTSPRLDALYTLPTFVQDMDKRHEVLEIRNMSTNIMPCASMADLHHDVGLGIATLVQGAKLWIFYPPSPENLRALEQSYRNSATTEGKDVFNNYRQLRNGVCFVQCQGSTLVVPSFCAHAVFTLQSSILVGREVYLMGGFAQRLENESLQVAWTMAERHDGLRENDVREQLRHLKVVLRTEDVWLRRGVLAAWDKSVYDGGLQRLIEGSGVKMEDWRKVWKAGTEDWASCPVCGEHFDEGLMKDVERRNLRKKETSFIKHFEAVHWMNEQRKA